MATETSVHDLIMAKRVLGEPVYNRTGDRIGHVENLSVQKASGQVIYAILSIGGFLGIGEELHPIPWSILTYDPDRAGYVVPLDREQLAKAPALAAKELENLGAGEQWRNTIYDYYGPYGAVPYF